jgi:hypothetical protein
MKISVHFGCLVTRQTIGYSISGDNLQAVVEYGQLASSKFFNSDEKSGFIQFIFKIIEEAYDLSDLVDKVFDLAGLIEVNAEVIVGVSVQRYHRVEMVDVVIAVHVANRVPCVPHQLRSYLRFL